MFDPKNQWPDLLLAWLTRYVRQAAELPSTDWRTVLQSGSAFWRLEGGACSEFVMRGVIAVHMLAAEMQRNPPQNPPSLLLDWQELATAVSAQFPFASLATWQNLFAEPNARNPLIGGLVGKALDRGLEKARLPQSAAATLMPLIQHARRAVAVFPMPPAAEFGVELTDYLLPAQNLATWNSLVESLIANLPELKIALQAVCTRPEMANVAIVSDDILQQARCGAAGWPILQTEQRRKQKKLLALLQGLTRAKDTAAAFSADLIRSVSTFIPGTLPALGEQQVPGAARSTTDPSAIEPLQIGSAHLLSELVRRLASSNDPQAAGLMGRIKELAQGLIDEPAQEQDPACQRCVLSCLIDVDELNHKRRNVGWIKPARDVLRQVIADMGRYRLLDSELVGALPEKFAGRIEAVGWIESHVKPGSIAAVVQPGYELLNPDGANTLLCRAKILLAR